MYDLDEFIKMQADDNKFNAWINKMSNLIDENESSEVEEFLMDTSLIEALLSIKNINDSTRRKQIFDLAKKMYKYCTEKETFKHITMEYNLKDSLEARLDKKLLLNYGTNKTISEVDDFAVDYFGLRDIISINMENLVNIPFSPENLENSKLFEKLKEFILTQKIDNKKSKGIDSGITTIERLSRFYYKSPIKILEKMNPSELDNSEMALLLYTRNAFSEINEFYEQGNKDYIVNSEFLKEYFQEKFKKALENVDKYPEVLKIAKICEKIERNDIKYATPERIELGDFISDYYCKNGDIPLNQIDLEKIKNSDKEMLKKTLNLASIYSTSLTFCNKVVSIFNCLQETGIDFVETDAFNIFQETAFNIVFEGISQPEERKNRKVTKEELLDKKDITDNEYEKDILDIFFEDMARKLSDEKVNLFSKRGYFFKNFLKAVRGGVKEWKPIYQDIMEKYNYYNIDLDAEKKMAEEFEKNNSLATNEKDFDEYLEHLQNIKIKSDKDILPMSSVKYIIKQALLSKSVIEQNPDKYLPLVECAVEDLARNDLPAKIQVEKPYFFLISDDVGTGRTQGLHDRSGYIQIKREGIRNLINYKDVSVLHTVFHENVHASQVYDFEHYQDKSITYNRFVMEKEELISEKIPEFYLDNYDRIFMEIEANEKAAVKLSALIKSFNFDKDLQLGSLNSFSNELIDDYERTAEELHVSYDESENVLLNGKDVNIYKTFDRFIKMYPNYLEVFPDLMIEYKSDGSPKSVTDLLKYGIEMANSKEKYLIAKIINKSGRMTKDSFSEDMKTLIGSFGNFYDKSLNSSVGTMFLKKIVVENVGKVGEEILSNLDSMSESENQNINDTIASIRKAMNNPENKHFADAMNSVNHRNEEDTKSPIQILNEVAEKIRGNEQNLDSIRFMMNAFILTSPEQVENLEKEMVSMVEVNQKLSFDNRENTRINEEDEKNLK